MPVALVLLVVQALNRLRLYLFWRSSTQLIFIGTQSLQFVLKRFNFRRKIVDRHLAFSLLRRDPASPHILINSLVTSLIIRSSDLGDLHADLTLLLAQVISSFQHSHALLVLSLVLRWQWLLKFPIG